MLQNNTDNKYEYKKSQEQFYQSKHILILKIHIKILMHN